MRLTAAAQIALAQLTGDAVPHSALRRPFDGQNEKLGEFIDMHTSVERRFFKARSAALGSGPILAGLSVVGNCSE